MSATRFIGCSSSVRSRRRLLRTAASSAFTSTLSKKVSTAGRSSASRPIRSQWEASAVATEMKTVAKRKLGSSYEIDRRRT